MSILIAYYSWRGHTEKVATAFATLLGAVRMRIEPVSESGMLSKALMAALSRKSPIKPAKTDLSDIDILIIATPVWAGKIPPYMNEYLDSLTAGEGKPFYVITEMGSRGAKTALAAVRTRLQKKGMHFISSAATIEKDVDSGAFTRTIEKFAAGILKT